MIVSILHNPPCTRVGRKSQLCDMQYMALLSGIPSLPETKTPVLLLDFHVLLPVLARAPASIAAPSGYRAYSTREVFCLWRDTHDGSTRASGETKEDRDDTQTLGLVQPGWPTPARRRLGRVRWGRP